MYAKYFEHIEELLVENDIGNDRYVLNVYYDYIRAMINKKIMISYEQSFMLLAHVLLRITCDYALVRRIVKYDTDKFRKFRDMLILNYIDKHDIVCI